MQYTDYKQHSLLLLVSLLEKGHDEMKITERLVGFEVLTVVQSAESQRRFGGTYRLHLQGRISRAQYLRECWWQAECYIPEESTLLKDLHIKFQQNLGIIR
jgi:hypothetical protein